MSSGQDRSVDFKSRKVKVATRVPVVLKKVLRSLQAQGKAMLTLIAL